jgi:hypothetical protein
MTTIRVAGYLVSIATMAVWLSTCATAKPPEAVPAPATQSAPRSAAHIYVTGDTLDSACYQEVGQVSYVEPFSAAATDPENLAVADELRKAAVKKYPNRVDAIINVHTEDHDIGSEVLVSGEAVQLEPPSKLDCQSPDKLAAAFVNFTTGSRALGEGRGATPGLGYNGPAGTTNTAADAEGNSGAEQGWKIKEGFRRAVVATMPGQTQVNESALTDQVQLQQAEIKRLRKEIDRRVGQQCEAQDISATECASMQKNAEFQQPHEAVAVANNAAGNGTPSVFEIQNMIQAQQELITKLRKEVADINETLDEAASPKPSN